MKNAEHIGSASDEHLVELLREGDRKALEEIYERYYDVLLRFSIGFVKEQAIAEDLVQECFIKLIDKASEFDLKKRFKTWIFTLSANACKNYLRNQQNRRNIEQGIASSANKTTDQDLKLDQNIFQQEVQIQLKQLSEKEQQLHHLRFEMDLSIQEISEIMNIPEGSVKSGLFYLLKKLRTQLKAFKHVDR